MNDKVEVSIISDAPKTTADQPGKKHDVKSSTQKHVREVEIRPSDRLDLVAAANTFVGHMVYKQVMPFIAAGFSGAEVPMTPQEQQTFVAALEFLKRQFDVGFRDTESLEKRIESEITFVVE